jgi:hypothetical protein
MGFLCDNSSDIIFLESHGVAWKNMQRFQMLGGFAYRLIVMRQMLSTGAI